MPNGIPKDHYVPQMYLDAFAIEGPGMKNPHIYQYIKDERLDIVPPRIKDVAGEKHFYTVDEKGTGKKIRVVDDFFTAGETAAAEPLKRLILRKNLEMSDDDRGHLSLFIAMLAVRTPGFIKGMESFEEEMIKELYALEVMNKERFHKKAKELVPDFEEKDIEDTRQLILKKEYGVSFGGKAKFLKQGIETAIELGERYYEKKFWHLLISESERVFITSDNPVSIYRSEFTVPRWTAGYGNGTLLIPVSPQLALVLRDVPYKSPEIIVSGSRIDRLNENTMAFSDNYIFSNLRSTQILRKYKQIGSKKHQKSTAKRHKFAPYIFTGPPPAPLEPLF